MKTLKTFIVPLFFAFFLFICQTSIAQIVTISPQPQKIKWGEAKAFNNNTSFKVKGLKTADTDATALLKKEINIAGKDVRGNVHEHGRLAHKA